MESMRKEEHIGSTFIDHNPAALPPRKRLKSLGSSASPPSTPSTPPPPLRSSNDSATTPQGIKRKKPEANEEQKELFVFSHLPPRKALKLKNDTPSPSDSEPEQPARKGRPGRRPGSSNKAPKRARKNKEEETLYCLCRQPYDEQVFMIACDVCDDWFHGKCVGVTERQGQTLKTYICPLCSKRGAGHRRKRSVVKVDEDVNVEDEDEEEKENHEYQQQRRKRAKGQAMTRGRAKSASGSMARRGSINGTAAGRRGEGYDSPSAHSDDAAHFPTGETDSSKEDVVPRRVCVNKACSNSAKLNSKYCSTECGVRVATQFLEKQKAAAASEQHHHHQQQQQARPSPKSSPKPTDASVPASNVDDGLPNFSSIKRSLENSPDISAADDSDLRLLESLERQRGEVEQHLRTLAAKREEFAKAVQFSSALFASDADVSSASQPSTGQHSSSAATSSSSSSADGAREGPEMMDCFSCGQPIPGRNFARHLEQCYAKKEGLGSSSSAPLVSGHKLHSRMVDDGTIITYCNHYDSRNGGFCAHPFDSCPLHSDNKGKDEQLRLCGCPTGDFASGHCERLRRDCVKHFSWESIRKKDMELEKERQTHLMGSLDAEIEIVKARIRRRSSTRDDEHRTIEENATSTRQQHAPASK